MNESQLKINYDYPIYPIESTINSDRGFVNIDDRSQGGTHWCCFIIKDNKSFYFDSFGGQQDKILVNQLPKPIIYHIDKIQDKIFQLCG